MISPVQLRGIRLIASDLDGTLLRHDKTISPRNAEAIRLAQEAGLHVVAATGRYPTMLPALLSPLGIEYAVASNGAQACRLSTGELFFEQTIAAPVAEAIMTHLHAELPDVRFEVVVDHGRQHWIEAGFLDLVLDSERRHFPLDYHEASRPELLDHDILRLNARHPFVQPDDMLAVLNASGLSGFHGTTSGAPFLEIGGEGVTKARGVAHLATLLGVKPSQVLAVGDARNDVEMLEWSGVGVAMGNAVAEAIAAADHTTASNEEDGLALVIEALLAR